MVEDGVVGERSPGKRSGVRVSSCLQAVLIEQALVDEERKILDELGSRGADRAGLMSIYAELDGTDGHARGLKALEFTRAVDEAVASIGDIRGSQVEDRHKKLALAQSKYEDTLRAWDGATSNPIGMVAVTIGLADHAPAF